MGNITINTKQLLLIIIVYPFFKTYYFSTLGIIPELNQILFTLSLIIICIFYLLELRRLKLNSGMMFVIMYYLLILISTTLKDFSPNSEYFSLITFSLGFSLLVNYCLQTKTDFLYFSSAIRSLLYIYVVANLFFMIIYPNGIPSITTYVDFPQYVFGNENSVIKLVLPGLCFVFLHDLVKFKKVKKKSWLLLILVWVTLFTTWSVTSMIGLFVFTFMVLNKFGKRNLFFDYYFILAFSICASIIIIFLRYEINILANVLQIFGKDLTFSNRDFLWINTIESIKESPIWGYGVQNTEEIWKHIGNAFGSHNYYLDTTFRGGLTALIFLISGLIYFGKRITINNNHVTRTITGTSCAYFMMWITEPFISTEFLMFSILFVLMSRIDLVLEYYYET
ncbi:O-antigen ligase family protein [Alkalihalobacillus sp. CinArs1]|uniref:O-antigen ligase family protein n=1 Tax=Alkalihalobacillus sp. CinArs1 TaxID=2995314 RepID=UPI0022DE4540|nr:O-antigen ligase family protein [Alkalihalobacillus sp. CinArs1]